MDRSGLEKVAQAEWIKAVYFSPFRQIELRGEKPVIHSFRAGKRGRIPRIRETFVTTWSIVARPMAGVAPVPLGLIARNTSSGIRSPFKCRSRAVTIAERKNVQTQRDCTIEMNRVIHAASFSTDPINRTLLIDSANNSSSEPCVISPMHRL